MSDGLADGAGGDQRHGRYLMSTTDSIDGEELANACRRLGISGPLEPLLRELKKDSSANMHHHHHHHHNNKESNRKHTHKSQRKSRNKECLDDNNISVMVMDGHNNATNTNAGGKISTYGQESWGRDSGARDLSPEPHRVPASSGTDSQLTDNETGGVGGGSSMIQLANKVIELIINYD